MLEDGTATDGWMEVTHGETRTWMRMKRKKKSKIRQESTKRQ